MGGVVGWEHKHRHRRGVHRAHQPRLRVARPPKREVPKVARRSPVGVRRDETDERPAEEQRAEPRDARVPQSKGGAAQLEASHLPAKESREIAERERAETGGLGVCLFWGRATVCRYNRLPRSSLWPSATLPVHA